LILITGSPALAQRDAFLDSLKYKTSLDGYVKYLNTAIIPEADTSDLITDNLFHNRLNFQWNISKHWTFNTSMRNRLFWGELVRLNPEIFSDLGRDPGYLDLSILWINGDSYALHTIFDRLYFTYEKGKLNVILGRHRVNWGMTFIWNPNDIFNSYSFFDFDYEERPGTDALEVNYYTSATSQFGLVYEFSDSLKGSSLAARYRWNARTYDFQLFAGYQRQNIVLGGGWAGDIKGAGFRGEGTYFIPVSDLDLENQFVGSMDLDYAFPKGLTLQISYLFNSSGLNSSTGDYSAFFLDRALSAQTLSPAMHNLFFQGTYPVTPIVNVTLATMLNPADGSWFIGPSVSWSVFENFDFLFNSQLFRGDPMTLFGDGGSFLFMRFKYSF
jgi:hypothetical protein